MNGLETFLRQLLDFGPQILSGLGHTVLLASIITVTGLLGGILVFYLTLSPSRLCRRLTEGYISFFIGTPLIALLFLMYYGLPQWGLKLTPLAVAVIGFTMNVAAYNARYLATAYRGLDQDELQAARAQGFTEPQIFRLITLPQVLRLSVPALSNQVILNLKDSSVAFLIQYTEFFAQMQDLAIRNFQFFKAYVTAGLVYLAMVSVIVIAARWVERRVVLPGTRRV
ncbi:Inner membrane amino-acid ABC transporter permease protein YecS [Pigmentiphaga humi]|uniref:Inner membrane amino-acid ABC transporter permease protein YecS n=1 Tax=Pigmentiphaga humi TaxID=2478468 RepID=A0A3P4AYM1_9BURK|nr:amino acid ABC transporter permease [Pigmentiphaga humi]VCU68882.1 Inner membrane amino-acid ABC transporter permease protein YecS [Pigmentiphaga humi]